MCGDNELPPGTVFQQCKVLYTLAAPRSEWEVVICKREILSHNQTIIKLIEKNGASRFHVFVSVKFLCETDK